MSDKKLKVMVIEDEAMLLDIIERKLEETGITVVSCTSAEEALRKLAGHEVPDSIWLDYHLKGMDGLEFMAKLKQDDRLKDIPVVVVSNSANESTVSKLMEAGAKHYLLKAQNKLDDIITILNSLSEKK